MEGDVLIIAVPPGKARKYYTIIKRIKFVSANELIELLTELPTKYNMREKKLIVELKGGEK